MNEPTKVKTAKRGKFILTTPAGNEINVRTMGSRREMKAAQSPQRANQRSACSRSSSCTMIQWP